MKFAPTEEQRMLSGTLHDLLTGAETPKAVRAWAGGDHDRGLDLWRSLARVGVTALAVPERSDGAGRLPVELALAFDELGHHAVPGPYVETVATAALLERLGDESLRERWLPALARGELVATLSLEPECPYLLDADVAWLVLAVHDGALYASATGDTGDALQRSVDPARRLFRAGGDATVLASGQEVGAAADAAREVGALACAGQLLGLGRMLVEQTTAYATQREQFGRPIGEFQAVKHHLADAKVGIEFARPLVHGAAVALDSGSPQAGRDISAAKVAAGRAAYTAARTALQVHGAIGYTDEYDLSLWIRKARALVNAWGTQAAHRARVTDALAG